MITSSSSFVLESVAEFFEGKGMVMEDGRGNKWRRISCIMKEVINTFEKWPGDVNMVEKEATVKIRESRQNQDCLHSLVSASASGPLARRERFFTTTLRVKLAI